MEQYPAEYPADRYALNENTGHYIEWRREITDADTLFDQEVRIARSIDATPANEVVLDAPAIARGLSWSDYMERAGSGEHSLRAIVNVNKCNLAVVDTEVDGRSVTYIAHMGIHKDEQATLLGVMDTPEVGEDTELTFYEESGPDRWEGFSRGIVSFRKSADGTVRVSNESVEQVRVGLAAEPQPERSFKERFSLKSIYQGLKRAIKGEQPQNSGKREAFIGSANWIASPKVTSFSMSEAARWMRQNQCNSYVTQSV